MVKVLGLPLASPILIYCIDINQYKINVKLLYLCFSVVLLPQKRFFEGFWRILSSLFTVPNNRRTREESLFWKDSSAGAIFLQKIALLRFQTSQQKGQKIHSSPWICWPFCCKVWKRSNVIFWGKIAPALMEPFQNKDSSLVLLLLGTVNGALKILQNCSKKLLLRQKYNNIPQVR